MPVNKLVVAITGGTGFVGRCLAEFHIRRGDFVRVLSRQGLPSGMTEKGVVGYTGDLLGDIPVSFADQADVLYHCAAELNNPSLCWQTNVEGTRRLLQRVQNVGRWVQLSSVGVYGPKRSGFITEDTPLLPENPYECSKAEADRLLIEHASISGLDYSILRPSNIFGPSMSNHSLYRLVGAIERGVFCFIGPHGASANYIFVNNVVDALFLCAAHQRASGSTFNLSDWRTLEEFIAAIAVTLKIRTPSLRLPAMPMHLLAWMAQHLPHNPLTTSRVDALTNRAVYPIDSIESELGYRHGVSMEQGLALTIADSRLADQIQRSK